MKTEFTRPFDLDHAIAGAPIATVDRGPARFVAYADEADRSCCVIVLDMKGVVGTRRKSGRVNEFGATDNPFDLVMTPLGLIDGKPVFVGDIVKSPDCKQVEADHRMNFGEGSTWQWPAPERMYPETQMTDAELCTSVPTMHKINQSPSACEQFILDGFRSLANAALRHAIDAKQVITTDEHLDALMALGQNMKGVEIKRHAARDMAIAEAVRNCARNNFHSPFENLVGSHAYGRISNINLAAIIATVK